MKDRVLGGRYAIEEEIGRGGMATVFRAFDRSLERRVAVKVLNPEFSGDETTVARFRAEAQAAARLSHPSIAQIYDTGVDEGDHFIVMEYLPEPDLKTIIRNYAPLPVHKAAEVALEACEALGYAHQHGIVHRDVKPHNILFTAEGRAKLVDFGIAAAVGERAKDGALLGSAHYLSPEEVRGNAPTPQSDLYSLGVVMYECLTGRTPFQGETAEAVLSKRLSGPPPAPRTLNPNLPPAAELVVMKAMARDPNQRYLSAGEMLADLRRLLAGAPVEATPSLTEATKTLVLPRHPEAVTPPPVREAPRGTRAPAPAAPAAKEGPNWVWGVVGFLGGVLALVALVYVFRAILYPGQPQVSVPGVTGVSREQAAQMLADAGLELGAVTDDPEAEQTPGTVTSQDPAMGLLVPKGTKVDLVVAMAGDTKQTVVEVIKVVGLSKQDAEQNLRAVHLKVGTVEEVYDAEVPAGVVVSQAIPAGTGVAEWSAVGLAVSKGPEPPAAEGSQPTPEEGKPGEPVPVDADPSITVADLGPSDPADPSVRKCQVLVMVQGTQTGQQIRIVLRDDTHPGGVVIHEDFYDGGDRVDKTETTHGVPTFEVYRDGVLVGQARVPLPPTEGNDR